MKLSRYTRIAACGLVTYVIVAVGRAADDTTFTPILIKGHPTHPTQLLAEVKPVVQVGAQATVLAAKGLRAICAVDRMPGLVELAAAPPVQAIAGASAGVTNAEIHAAKLLAWIEALRASDLIDYGRCRKRQVLTPDKRNGECSLFLHPTVVTNSNESRSTAGLRFGARDRPPELLGGAL